jgi:hypothetical protein
LMFPHHFWVFAKSSMTLSFENCSSFLALTFSAML